MDRSSFRAGHPHIVVQIILSSLREIQRNFIEEGFESSFDTSFNAFTRVLVRPIGLDMVEVGGSNPPIPATKAA